MAAFCPFAPAQQTSTYSLAREAYQDRLSQDLRQLRQEIDMSARAAPQAAQPRFAPAYDALNTAEQAFAAMKTASNLEFAHARSAAESAIAKARREWSVFRLNQPERNPRPEESQTEK
ncbi:hypothetical protein DB347_14510 [Opitutaceae bacterium EW11]|nr:hypothetical protein DB347_14510 [Opitutaceae bacterium EW11]